MRGNGTAAPMRWPPVPPFHRVDVQQAADVLLRDVEASTGSERSADAAVDVEAVRTLARTVPGVVAVRC